MSLITPATAYPFGRDYPSLAAYFAERGYPPPHPYALLWPRMPEADQAALTRSIAKHGSIREPITVVGTGSTEQIIDGLARSISAIEAGLHWGKLRKTQFEGSDAELLEFVVDKNVRRRHLDASQRAMAAARLATMRQGARTDLAQICARSQRQAAEQLNVSRRLVVDAGNIQNAAVPEIQEAVDNGRLPVSVAVLAINLPPDQQRHMAAKAIAASKPSKVFIAGLREFQTRTRHSHLIANARRIELGGKRYAIVVIDNPWDRRVSWAESPFPRLPINEICQFRIDGRLLRDVIAEDAIVYLWILDCLFWDPQRPLERIYEALGGLRPRYLKPWPKPAIRTGYYARYQHETCLVCTRGDFPPPVEHLRQSTLIVGPKLPGGGGFRCAPPHDDRHSSKPPRLQEMIEQEYPQYFGPETVDNPLALELFARNYRPKWDGHGFEYPGRPARDATTDLIRISHASDDDLLRELQ